MPIYGYECSQCGHQLEVLQSLSEEPLRTCPECMGPLRKLLYPVGVIFKGSGFYSTDYKSSSNGKSSSSERPGDSTPAGETKGDSKAESTAESKAEKKPESKPEAKASGD